MKYDYKTIGIIVLSIIAFILLIVLLLPSKEKTQNDKQSGDDILLVNINDVVFRLLGDTDYTLNSNEEYVEPGYVAYIKNGSDIKDFVTIKEDGVVENGHYRIKYYLEYENIKKTLTRNITIKNTSSGEVKIPETEKISINFEKPCFPV